MKTIHQYHLDGEKQVTTLALRDGYRIVRCEYLVAQKRVCLWVEELLRIDLPVSDRQFMVVGSGTPVPVSYQHVDTALDPFGPQAFHVYEVIAPAELPTNCLRKPFSSAIFGEVERQHA
ncbi:hypothetical protein RPW65_15110 [Pseudomonas sp. NyZ704]|nr:hypothetical protein RPW65_15110 [Pseudomonas sp. NyZ704]